MSKCVVVFTFLQLAFLDVIGISLAPQPIAAREHIDRFVIQCSKKAFLVIHISSCRCM
jgi:hypothetical protein